MQIKLILAVVGTVALSLGVFSPFLTVPVVGAVNLFNQGKGSGVLLIILAGVGLVTALLRRWSWLWVVAGAAGGVLLYTYLTVYFGMLGAQEAAKIGLADNPFGGLGQMFLGAIQISWGLPLMVLGVLLLGLSAGLPNETGSQNGAAKNPRAWLPLSIGMLLLLGFGGAGAVHGQQARIEAVAQAKAEAAKAAEDARRAEEQRQQEEAARAAADAAEQQARQDALNSLRVDFDWQNDEYSRYLVGTVKNESDRVIHFVTVKFSLTDEDDILVGDTSDIVDSIQPGQTWAFKAYVSEDNAYSARLNEVTGRAYEY